MVAGESVELPMALLRARRLRGPRSGPVRPVASWRHPTPRSPEIPLNRSPEVRPEVPLGAPQLQQALLPHWMLQCVQNDGPPVVDRRTSRAERPCRFGDLDAPDCRQGHRCGPFESRPVSLVSRASCVGCPRHRLLTVSGDGTCRTEAPANAEPSDGRATGQEASVVPEPASGAGAGDSRGVVLGRSVRPPTSRPAPSTRLNPSSIQVTGLGGSR
jgi:hypothetical protein